MLLAASAAASGVPPLASFSTAHHAIQTCPSAASSAPACAGYERPQLAGRVPGDNATLCFHLGCCYTKATGACTAAPDATLSTAAGAEWFSGNEPIPALSNTRGTVQLPLETSDALAVDCVYFPPFFSTCDGSRSDSRFDRQRDPFAPIENPTFGGATQNLRVNGAALRALSYSWAPHQLVRSAAAAGLPWLAANTTVRMVMGASSVLLTYVLHVLHVLHVLQHKVHE